MINTYNSWLCTSDTIRITDPAYRKNIELDDNLYKIINNIKSGKWYIHYIKENNMITKINTWHEDCDECIYKYYDVIYHVDSGLLGIFNDDIYPDYPGTPTNHYNYEDYNSFYKTCCRSVNIYNNCNIVHYNGDVIGFVIECPILYNEDEYYKYSIQYNKKNEVIGITIYLDSKLNISDLSNSTDSTNSTNSTDSTDSTNSTDSTISINYDNNIVNTIISNIVNIL